MAIQLEQEQLSGYLDEAELLIDGGSEGPDLGLNLGIWVRTLSSKGYSWVKPGTVDEDVANFNPEVVHTVLAHRYSSEPAEAIGELLRICSKITNTGVLPAREVVVDGLAIPVRSVNGDFVLRRHFMRGLDNPDFDSLQLSLEPSRDPIGGAING